MPATARWSNNTAPMALLRRANDAIIGLPCNHFAAGPVPGDEPHPPAPNGPEVHTASDRSNPRNGPGHQSHSRVGGGFRPRFLAIAKAAKQTEMNVHPQTRTAGRFKLIKQVLPMGCRSNKPTAIELFRSVQKPPLRRIHRHRCVPKPTVMVGPIGEWYVPQAFALSLPFTNVSFQGMSHSACTASPSKRNRALR